MTRRATELHLYFSHGEKDPFAGALCFYVMDNAQAPNFKTTTDVAKVNCRECLAILREQEEEAKWDAF